MYQQKLRKWTICTLLILLALCFTAALTSRITAAAESGEDLVAESQEETISVIAKRPEPASTMNAKGELYKNLGEYRCIEGALIDGLPLTNLHYIENANYFLANPKHRENYNTTNDHIFGTCTTVAHQILLGYHNYYSDRRLIPAIGQDGTQYLSSD